MRSVSGSPMLECLHLTDCDEDALFGSPFNALTANLPGFLTLKSLRFTATGRIPALDDDNSSWSRFVDIIRQNSSLIDVVGLHYYDDQMFSNDKLVQLDRYGDRNRALSRLLDSNGCLPVQLWPSLATSVRRCEYGLSWIVRMVMALEQ